MAADKKNKEILDINNIDEWLRSTGFLFPKTELQLARLNKLYEDYDFKLKNASIDINSIVEGNICFCRSQIIKFEGNSQEEFETLKMVARKGHEIPSHIIDKMKQKHRKNNDNQ
jgi:hypothetical protein